MWYDIIVISLMDQVYNLKKQLAAKEQIILEKEKQVHTASCHKMFHVYNSSLCPLLTPDHWEHVGFYI